MRMIVIEVLSLILLITFHESSSDWIGIDPCQDEISCSANISVSNPENCGEYFLCIWTSLYPQVCPSGYQFDQNLVKCLDTRIPGIFVHCLPPCDNDRYKKHIVYTSSSSSTDSTTPMISSVPSSGKSTLRTSSSRTSTLEMRTPTESDVTTSTPSLSTNTPRRITTEVIGVSTTSKTLSSEVTSRSLTSGTESSTRRPSTRLSTSPAAPSQVTSWYSISSRESNTRPSISPSTVALSKAIAFETTSKLLTTNHNSDEPSTPSPKYTTTHTLRGTSASTQKMTSVVPVSSTYGVTTTVRSSAEVQTSTTASTIREDTTTMTSLKDYETTSLPSPIRFESTSDGKTTLRSSDYGETSISIRPTTSVRTVSRKSSTDGETTTPKTPNNIQTTTMKTSTHEETTVLTIYDDSSTLKASTHIETTSLKVSSHNGQTTTGNNVNIVSSVTLQNILTSSSTLEPAATSSVSAATLSAPAATSSAPAATSSAPAATSSAPAVDSTTFYTTFSPEDTTIASTSPTDLSGLCVRQNPCTAGDRFGDVIDCTKYFECTNFLEDRNYWMPKACPDGQNFDAQTENCIDHLGHPGICLQDICQTKLNHTIEIFPEIALAGNQLKLSCSFRILFVLQPVEVSSIVWRLNGDQLTSTAVNQRIQVGPIDYDDFGVWNSTLSFHPVTIRDSGIVDCIVHYGNQQTSISTTKYIRVFPTPSVDLNPLNAVVVKNETLVLVCTSYFDESESDWSFENDSVGLHTELNITWYRAGQIIDFTNDSECTVSGAFNVSVVTCRPTFDSEFLCRAKYALGFTDSLLGSVKVVEGDSLLCKEEDFERIFWPQAIVNTTSVASCGPSSRGLQTRRCLDDGNSTIWETPNSDDCVDKELFNLLSQARDIRQGISLDNSNQTEAIADGLRVYLLNSAERLTFGNFNTSLEILQELGSIHTEAWNITKPSVTEIKMVLWSTSDLLNSTNHRLWKTMVMRNMFGAVPVMSVVDIYGKKWANSLSPGNADAVNYGYITMNTMCDYRSRIRNVSFPMRQIPSSDDDDDDTWVASALDGIQFRNPSDYRNSSDNDTVYYISSSLYRNLNSYLPGSSPDVASNSSLGSRIISLTIDGLSSSNNLSIPVRIILENSEATNDSVNRSCVFWNPGSKPSGSWSDFGCQYVPSESNSKKTVCECEHLTNFAILFSPSPAKGLNDVILSQISMIGCIVSLVSLVLTLLLLAIRWKKIRSHHIVVLVNLCVALILANAVFLIGVYRTGNAVFCKVIAVLLHFFFLAAFCVMLVEGLQLLLYTARPFYFHRKRDTFLLLLAAWTIPLVIVGVSLAVTRTEGYGTKDTCWLSVDNGLLWAFIGPTLAIILTNFVILIIVLVNLARTKRAIERTPRTRIWATMWNVFMITPVLGVTWIFGVFSVNQELVVFQYIFAIANSLQGFFIFLFHGLCYRKHSKSKALVTASSRRTSLPPHQPEVPSQARSASRSMKVKLTNHMKRLSKRHAVTWVAIAAAAVASSTDHVELQECDDEVERGGIAPSEPEREEPFSRSLRPTISNTTSCDSNNTNSTDKTDILF